MLEDTESRKVSHRRWHFRWILKDEDFVKERNSSLHIMQKPMQESPGHSGLGERVKV